MSKIDPAELMNSSAAASYLGVTIDRVNALRRKGRIGTQIGGFWLYSKSELDQYMVTRKTGRPKGYSPKHKRREQNSAKKTQQADDSPTNG